MGAEFLFSPMVMGIFFILIFVSCRLQYVFFKTRFNSIGVLNVFVGYVVVAAIDISIALIDVRGDFSEWASTAFLVFIMTIPFITFWVLPAMIFLAKNNSGSVYKTIFVILFPCILIAFFMFSDYEIENRISKGFTLTSSEILLLTVVLASIGFFFAVRFSNKSVSDHPD